MNFRFGGSTRRRLFTAALAVIAIFVYWTQFSDHGATDVARNTPAAAAREPAPPSSGWGAAIGFADQRRLDEHFQKHGVEFGRITKQDYLRQAQLLRDSRPGGPILETVRRDGVTTRFDRDTGAFIAFNPNGVIRTFFKPNDGERYYRRQAERGSE